MLIFLRRYLRSFKNPRGFTLIELLVVTAIIVIITTFILLRHARFDSSTLLRSLAYSVALTVRQAQVYGTSVRGTQAGSFAASAYGVYFNNKSSYILFADNNNTGQYESGADTAVQTFQLGKGFEIAQACATSSAGQQCWLPSGGAISWLSIVFRRPNPDACFASSSHADDCDNDEATEPPLTPYTKAYIQIRASADPANTRGINILNTGQVEVLQRSGS